MSVPKGKRGESDVEFLRTARELQLYTIKKCVGFPKRYTFYVSQPIAECATRTYEYLKCANSLYPMNQHEAQLRIDYELHANAELNSLVSQLEVAGQMEAADAYAGFQSWRAYADNFSAHRTIRNIGALYDQLFIKGGMGT